MLPLNMAILDFFCDGKEHNRHEVQEGLKANYGNFKAFSDKGMDEALQTAFSNGLLAESRLEMDGDKLVCYYQADAETIEVIKSYL